MAVYKRTYHGYDGPLTSERWRFLVLPRYTFDEMRKNRRLFNFFMFCFAWPLVCTLFIYMDHNASLLRMLHLNVAQALAVDANFFLIYMGVQCFLGVFVAAFGGPSLIAPDLVNNAIPLYLSRPFSRLEYVLGKASVLMLLLSLMTWVPGLLLFLLEGNFSGASWMWANLNIASGIFFGSWVWIILLTCQALAYSTWARMKHLSSAMMFIVYFGSSAFGAAVNGILHTRWGGLLDISHIMGSVWISLFGEAATKSVRGAVFFNIQGGGTPLWTNWLMVVLICGFCLRLLNRKIQAVEVVK
jgi:ABC-2 type transport system permease protein